MGKSGSQRSRQDVHIDLGRHLRASLDRLHIRLIDARGVMNFSDTVRMAIARGIRQLEAELAAEVVTSEERRP